MGFVEQASEALADLVRARRTVVGKAFRTDPEPPDETERRVGARGHDLLFGEELLLRHESRVQVLPQRPERQGRCRVKEARSPGPSTAL